MKDTGGPAFPHSRLGSDADGMSLRDYFAAKASDADIEALRERTKREEVQINSMGRREISFVVPREWRQIARYMHADAMLAERESRETTYQNQKTQGSPLPVVDLRSPQAQDDCRVASRWSQDQ